MRRVGRALPATPVAIACAALLQPGATDAASLRARVRNLLQDLREREVPLALGRAFDSIRRRRQSEKSALRMRELDLEVLDAEEAELVVTLALAQLTRRRIVRKKDGVLLIPEGERPVVEYYANSIRHHGV
jgi:hypothetical protein